MACAYCYHSDQKNLPFQKGMMTKQMAFDVIAQCADLSVNSMKFNYRGEATLNQHYTEITTFAKSLACGSTFIDRITNSNFKIPPARREDVFKGLSALTKVKVSYDSFYPIVFETQRLGGNHDLTTENIDLFYNYPGRIKSETEIVIQAVRTKLNKDEDLRGEIKKRWPEATISIRDMVSGRTSKDLSSLEDRKRDPSERQTCIQAHARLIVHWDGRVSPCCPSISNDLLVGDVKTQSINEIWNSKKARSLRESLNDKTAFQKNPCLNCPSFESYKGYKAPRES